MVSVIEVSNVGTSEGLHHPRQRIGLAARDDRMNVRRHQDIPVNSYVPLAGAFAEERKEVTAIIVVSEDVAPIVASVPNVMAQAGKKQSWGRHEPHENARTLLMTLLAETLDLSKICGVMARQRRRIWAA